MTLIETARDFATTVHAGQVRKNAAQSPYVVHLHEVAGLVTRFGGSEAAITAAWLHDTVEDCGVRPGDLVARFGAEVAGIVSELTDDKSLPKAERKRRQIANAPSKSRDAALVNICDKLSNVRSVGATPPVDWSPERRAAYLDWAAAVVAALPAGAAEARAAFETVLVEARTSLSAG